MYEDAGKFCNVWLYFVTVIIVMQEGLVITNIVQTPRQALEANADDNVSIGGMSIRFSDIDSELTPSESEVSSTLTF